MRPINDAGSIACSKGFGLDPVGIIGMHVRWGDGDNDFMVYETTDGYYIRRPLNPMKWLTEVSETLSGKMRLTRALEDLSIHGDYMELFHVIEGIVIKHSKGLGWEIYFDSPMCYFLPSQDWEIREIAPVYKTKLGQEFIL
jgi:hypothetical protein